MKLIFNKKYLGIGIGFNLFGPQFELFAPLFNNFRLDLGHRVNRCRCWRRRLDDGLGDGGGSWGDGGLFEEEIVIVCWCWRCWCRCLAAKWVKILI